MSRNIRDDVIEERPRAPITDSIVLVRGKTMREYEDIELCISLIFVISEAIGFTQYLNSSQTIQMSHINKRQIQSNAVLSHKANLTR